jgi:Xaa-Pro aminopeptidase
VPRTLDVAAAQAAVRDEGLDAWLLYDFRGQNAIAAGLAGLDAGRKATRRWFWLLPAEGEPVALVSAVEEHVLEVPGRRVVYRGWRDLESSLAEMLAGRARVAMEVSPGAAVPVVARVDWGTVELVRSLGVEVVSSANLVQLFEARWTPSQVVLHERAAAGVLAAKDALFAWLGESLGRTTESEAQAFLLDRFAASGLETLYPPCVAIDDHAADPHFETATGRDDRTIGPGAAVLVDLWAKVAGERDAVYADVTWMAWAGADPSVRLAELWAVVRDARDAAISVVEDAVAAGRQLHGYEVDRAARGVITAAGYGDRFVHRTGHSLGAEVHGNGVNMDDLETRDDRLVLPGLAFTIEPGVYLPGELGVRSEVNVVVEPGRARVTTEAQRELVLLG